MSTRKPVRIRQLSPAGAALPLRVQCLNGAPLKRFIGRTRQGFDFLGYQLRVGAWLRPSAEGLLRHIELARQIYEREGYRRRLTKSLARGLCLKGDCHQLVSCSWLEAIALPGNRRAQKGLRAPNT